MKIGPVEIGSGRVYIIAEAGVNHNGDIALAKRLIDYAKSAGADAIKFQTFTLEEMVTDQAEQAEYQKKNTGISQTQAEMLKKLALTQKDFKELKKYADTKGIEFLSTPFSIPDADFLRTLDLSAYKVSSGDLTNIPFLQHIAAFGKPLLISTGMATLDEVRESFDSIRGSEVILMQCTSEYPTPLSHANLRVIETLKKEFGTLIGYSDHTEGLDATLFAIALGATVIEKHFTLDIDLPGPDHKISLEPVDLKELIERIRDEKFATTFVPEEVLGSAEKKPTPEERLTAKLVRKGIAARNDILAGETLTADNILIARPEGDMRPKEWSAVLGKRAKRDIPRGSSLSWDMLEI